MSTVVSDFARMEHHAPVAGPEHGARQLMSLAMISAPSGCSEQFSFARRGPSSGLASAPRSRGDDGHPSFFPAFLAIIHPRSVFGSGAAHPATNRAHSQPVSRNNAMRFSLGHTKDACRRLMGQSAQAITRSAAEVVGPKRS